MKKITKILAVTLAALAIATLFFVHFSPQAEEYSRFTFERAEDVPGKGYILTDTVTGDQYLFVDGTAVKLEPAPEPIEVIKHPYATEAEFVAKTIYGEARGCSKTEQAAVVWCILNRVDSEDPFFPDNIVSVITQENQFSGYDPDHPVEEEYLELAMDVIDLWMKEDGEGIVAGRVLPKEYMWFSGDGRENVFRDDYFYARSNFWDWTLASPY